MSDVLMAALEKVQRRRSQVPGDQEAFTGAELAALSDWLKLDLEFLAAVNLSRAEKRERNRAAWSGGDRTPWGGERRKRDARRGWRNFVS